jgi:AcrR family transcriptional regulator
VERRRGAALEDALLDAAGAELSEKGYAGFAIDAVANRAGTSTPVLYRRWPTKNDLVRAALIHNARRMTVEVPDTGSLRDDLLALVEQFNRPDAGLFTMLTVLLGGFFQETGTSPAELIDGLAPELPLHNAIDALYRSAAGRGEIDLDRLTPRLRALPFDLFRNELTMTLRPVPAAVVEEIVDEIFLPLARRKT